MFSLWKVCTIDDTVDLFTLGCTLRPASSIVKPWFMTWSMISSETLTLLFPPLPLSCLPLTPPPCILHVSIALPRACCCSSGLWKSSILKNGSDCGQSTYICSQTWLVKWLIQIVLQLEFICQFSRHYKQCQCQLFMEYTCMYTNFS